MSVGVRRNSVCGPGCAEIVAVGDGMQKPMLCRALTPAFSGECFSCAVRSTSVSSGSRLLSGRISTTGSFASPSPETGVSGAVSRQCALVFSQKMIAGMLPPLAAANKKPETVAVASATPRSRSSRKRLRSVFGAQPMILAMPSCGTPTPAKYRTRSRTASFTAKAFLAIGGPCFIMVRPLGALVEGLTRGVMRRGAPGETLPALHDDIDIGRVELDAAADAAGHFGCDQAGAGAQKRIIDRLAGPAVIGDRAAHAFDRLLGTVPPGLLALLVAERVVVGDFPDRRLGTVTLPVADLALAHRVPAGFVLPMIIAAAQGEVVLGPDDLSAQLQPASRQTSGNDIAVQSPVPDIGDIAGKQRIGLPPVDAIVVEHLAPRQGAATAAAARSPGRVVGNPVRRIGDHQGRL